MNQCSFYTNCINSISRVNHGHKASSLSLESTSLCHSEYQLRISHTHVCLTCVWYIKKGSGRGVHQHLNSSDVTAARTVSSINRNVVSWSDARMLGSASLSGCRATCLVIWFWPKLLQKSIFWGVWWIYFWIHKFCWPRWSDWHKEQSCASISKSTVN